MQKLALAVFLAALVAASATAQDQWPTKRWPTSTPAIVGLDAKALAELDADIAGGKYGYVDSMLVIRRGKAVYDKSYKHDYNRIYGKQAKETGPLNAHDPSGPYNYFDPWWRPFYRSGDLHTMQSVMKTVTSVVIGVAMARKEFPDLDTPILKFFDEKKVANIGDRKRRITIRHLLTMTGGFDWWLFPYGDGSRLAWAGSGFGGQMPIAVPEYDLVIVFTGWNIHDDRNKRLSHRVAIDRVIGAIVKQPRGAVKGRRNTGRRNCLR